MNNEMILIDNIPVLLEGEKNLLEVIRKAGIELPTFCYYSELSLYGACRICVVEDKWGNIHASCSTPPKAGMEIYTNTPRLRKHRKMILELLLSNHCRDCTTCAKNGKCRLQELAQRFGIKRVGFGNTAEVPDIDRSSPAIVRDKSKCILCGDCVRMCSEIQNVGAIDFAFRGSKMCVTPAFGDPIGSTSCVGCGQCAAVCPTGAIVLRNDTSKVWKELYDRKVRVVAQIAPAVRVALGEEFGLPAGENMMGKITAALRRMGFDEIFDTSTAADLTAVEEANEFLSRLEKGAQLPLFTSCCPAWVRYAETKHPELLQNLSTCRSPMEMFGSVLKEQYKQSDRRTVVVAVMPCTAKKCEADREEYQKDGVPYVDHVITTQELAQMIREAGIVFSEIEPEAVDMPFGSASGAGIIFGVTGGVTEAVVRRLSDDKSPVALRAITFTGVRGMEGLKEFTVMAQGRDVRIAIVSGLQNAETLLENMRAGHVQYDFVEVMACPGGCIGGAGQPFAKSAVKAARGKGLYGCDSMTNIRRAEENPVLMALYGGLLKGKTHELLHVSRHGKDSAASPDLE